MLAFIHRPTGRIVYVDESNSSSTFLQPIESELIRKQTSVDIPLDSCVYWTFEGTPQCLSSSPPPEAAILVHHRCKLLREVYRMIYVVRQAFVKTLPGQEYVYERKYQDACAYLDAARGASILVPSNLSYLQDEVEVLKQDPLVVALLISKRRQERENVMRASERARRYLTELICVAPSTEELGRIHNMIVPRNFFIPMVIA